MKGNRVRDWMTRRPITVPGTCTLPDAYLLMVNRKIRRLLVVDQGVLVGVVTLEDLRKNMPNAVISMDPMQEKFQVEKILVRDIMTANPKTISPNATLLQAAQVMLEFDFSTLPVMDGGRLVGIITESDIFEAMVKQIMVINKS